LIPFAPAHRHRRLPLSSQPDYPGRAQEEKINRLLAVLSDIHGNLRALDAVLQDMESRGVRDGVHLGDAVYGPLDPRGTAARMIERGIPSVMGNEDRLVISSGDAGVTLDFVRAELRSVEREWLSEFPPTLVLGDLFLCHGTPQDDTEYLLLDVSPSGVRPRRETDLKVRLTGVRQPVILCGHDHTPALVHVSGGPVVVNPGSVGCPAYRDDHPARHVIEAGSPHARYAILTQDERGWRCEHVSVPYDWNAASADARRHGRLDWAEALATGRAPAGDGTSTLEF